MIFNIYLLCFLELFERREDVDKVLRNLLEINCISIIKLQLQLTFNNFDNIRLVVLELNLLNIRDTS